MVCASARLQKKKTVALHKKTAEEIDQDAVFEDKYENIMNNSAMEKGFSVNYNLVDHKNAANGHESGHESD